MKYIGHTHTTGGSGHSHSNPIAGVTFYVDDERDVAKIAQDYRKKGDVANADLLSKIAAQPGTTWLTGPRSNDTQGAYDIAQVRRTSLRAARENTVPVYQLYAIPGRDACGSYSKGGFTTSNDYLAWIDKIIASLQSDAIFSVEADGVAQTVHETCLNRQQITERYAVLKAALVKLKASPHVRAAYLDAGHSEWFPDPAVIVKPLQDAGIDQASGIAVNVSFFVPTPEITAWSQSLVRRLGGNKGVIVDTSRNGQGAPPGEVTGDGRWCNPAGRGLGSIPTTAVHQEFIDGYFWGKIVGESDGACRGNLPAGSFDARLALELARNANQ